MNQKEALEQEVKDGKEAEMILNIPMVKNTLMGMKGELFSQFTATKTDEKDAREEIWRRMLVIDWFIDTFKSAIVSGNNATLELTRQDNVIKPISNKI